MLLELKVENFAIIDSLKIQFGNGLNIVSGETGAGKSVLLKSLSLMMGQKASADTVRNGCERALVEGAFDISQRTDIKILLADMGIDSEDDQLIIRRVISSQGKSRVYLNGSLSPLNSLREIVAPLIALTGRQSPLIEMTGQHENRNLQSRSYHLDVVDSYCGQLKQKRKFQEDYNRLGELERQIQKTSEDSRNRAQRIDFLIFQRDEIEDLNLKPGDEEDLEAQIHRLRNTNKLTEFASMAENGIYSDDDSALVRVHQILQKGDELLKVDPNLKNVVDSLSQAKALMEEVTYELREYARGLDADPDNLSPLEEKLAQLRRLQRKFGGSVQEILDHLNDIKKEIAHLESSDNLLNQLKSEYQQLLKSLKKQAGDLHRRRESGSQLLAKEINEELKELNMKDTLFRIDVQKAEELSVNGISDLEFLIQVTKDEPARPVAKVASGGELSRILLALKNVVGTSEHPRTYLFDEVDTGVSGPTAEKVGKKLKSIAKNQQIVCVTHLPQVAAFADHHFLIQKVTHNNHLQMNIKELKPKDRIQEIARLISGEKITKTSRDHAQSLLQNATTAARP